MEIFLWIIILVQSVEIWTNKNKVKEIEKQIKNIERYR